MTEWKIIGPIIGAMVSLFIFIARHVSNDKKHCTSDKMVYADVCEERGKSNAMAHQNLKEGIDAAIARSDEQHKELKADMRNGFGEIKSLIEKALCVAVVLCLVGCTGYRAEIRVPLFDETGEVQVAEQVAIIDMVYFLQKKDIKSFTMDPATGLVTFESLGSETSQVVEQILDKIPLP